MEMNAWADLIVRLELKINNRHIAKCIISPVEHSTSQEIYKI